MFQPEPFKSEPRVAKEYNVFFNPNICHVCKFQNNLTECSWCGMISYCSPQHIQVDKVQHRAMCQFIRTHKLRIYNTHDMTREQWLSLRVTNIRFAKQQLNRELQLFEIHMFMYAKSCVICHRQDNLTLACEFCLSVNKCLNHNSTPFEHSCDGLRHYLSIYTYSAMSGTDNIHFPMELLNFDVRTTRLEDMPSYFQHCLPDRNITTYNDIINTSFLSYPLTLLFGLVEANLLNRLPTTGLCVVHIIFGFPYEAKYLLTWEVILHQLQSKTRLSIVIIAPNLMEQHDKHNICQTCNRNEKELHIICYHTSYSDYVHSWSYMEPDTILAFNINFMDNYQQSAILAAVRVKHCPLILTCALTYLERIKATIWERAGKTPTVNRNNNFAPLLPLRNYDDNLTFHNKHLIVYYDDT